MKRLLLLLFLQVLCVNAVFAQSTDPFGFDSNISPTYSTYALAKYGDLSPSLYTGTMNMSIPLYTYSDEDFTVPVSLDYHYDGYRPSLHSGPVGLGWVLNVGGSVTREIMGLPDDYIEANVRGYYYPTVTNGFPNVKAALSDTTHTNALRNNVVTQSSPILPHDIHPSMFLGSSPMILEGDMYLGMSGFAGTENNTFFDISSDIYHFQFLGHKGSFYIMPSGQIKVFESDLPAGEIGISLDYSQVNYGQSKITIQTGDGYRYVFGYDEHWMECSYVASNSQRENEHIQNFSKYFSALKLYQIIAPNGRKVTFDYETENPYLEMTYTPSMQYSYHLRSAVANVQPSDFPYGWQYYDSNENIPLTVRSNISRLIQSVHVDDHEIIRFNYEDRSTGEYSTSAFSVGFGGYENLFQADDNSSYGNRYARFNKRNLLKSVVIRNRAENQIDSIRLVQSYTSTSTGHSTKVFLRSVTGNFGKFAFAYNNDSSGDAYPPIDCIATDHWGFWRSDGGTLSMTSGNIGQQDRDLYNISSLGREPDLSSMSFGALWRVTYPTGGYSKIEYEQNAVSRRINIDLEDENASGYYLESCSNMPVGGLRVKKITTCSTSQYGEYAKEVTFDYCNSGILYRMPRYAINVDAVSYGFQNMLNIRSLLFGTAELVGVMNMQNRSSFPVVGNQDDSFIGYTKVKSIYSDGSWQESNFTSWDEYPDVTVADEQIDTADIYAKCFVTHDTFLDYEERNSYFWGPESQDDLYRNAAYTGTVLSNMSDMRGRPSSVATFDRNGHKMKEVSYSYNLVQVGSSETMINCYSHLMLVTKSYFQPLLSSVTTTEYESEEQSSSVSVSYGYNSLFQKSSERTYSIPSTDEYKLYYRYSRALPLTVYGFRLTDVVETRKTGGAEYVIGFHHYDYSRTGIPKPISRRDYVIGQPYALPSDVFSPGVSTSDVTDFTYDNLFRLTHVQSQGGSYMSYEWDTDGMYPTKKIENGPSMESDFVWIDMVGLSSVRTPDGRLESYVYDDKGRIKEIRDNGNHVVEEYQYHLVNE